MVSLSTKGKTLFVCMKEISFVSVYSRMYSFEVYHIAAKTLHFVTKG